MEKLLIFIVFIILNSFESYGQTFEPYFKRHIFMKGIVSQNHIQNYQIIFEKDSIIFSQKNEDGEYSYTKFKILEKHEQENTKNGNLDYNERFSCINFDSQKIEVYLVEDIKYSELIFEIKSDLTTWIYRVHKENIQQKPFRFTLGTSWENKENKTKLDIYYDNLSSKVYALMKDEYNAEMKFEVEASSSMFKFYNTENGIMEMFATIKEGSDSQRYLYFNGGMIYLKEITDEKTED